MRAALIVFAAVAAGTGQAFAHAPERHIDDGAGLAWSWDPWVLVSLGLAALLYTAGARRLRAKSKAGAGPHRRRAVFFASGWLVTALALLSPIDTVGGELFSMHMIQHELLMLIAAPLLVLSSPGGVFAWSLPGPSRRAVSGLVRFARVLWRLLTLPLAAWLLHAVTLWIWHIPYLFEAGLESDLVHTVQHFSFFLAALVFWWSLLNGVGGHGVGVLSLFSTAIHSSVLGALLTLTPKVWYPFYAATVPRWGLTPLEDQQLGGLIMWVPGGAVFMAAGLWLLAQGLARSERLHRGGAGLKPAETRWRA